MESEFSRDLGRVITHINRLRKRYMSEKLSGYGLSGALYMYLLAIDKHPGESQDFLVVRFCADKGNVARAAKKLEEMGYLRREPDPGDRRQNRLFLTERGEALIPEIERYLREWSEQLTRGFSPEELRTARGLFARMEENAKAAEKK